MIIGMNYTLKVVKIKQETSDTVTLCFKQPGLKKIKYLAGQYLTLIFRINGRRFIRPYSFSSCPVVDEFLEITVKRVLNGIVSNHINDRVCVGDSIEVMPPMGDFTYSNAGDKKEVFLWGVGSGITPLLSITKYVLHNETETTVHLVFGNKNHESTIFLNQILSLKDQYKDRFVLTHFFTQPLISIDEERIIQGRINTFHALDILNKTADLQNTLHYICGPAGLKESVKAALFKSDISEEKVFVEEFEIVKDPADFVDIHTQVVGLKFNGEHYNLEVSKGKSILEAALDSNIELPYSCQTGNCNTCLGKLTQGKSKMIGLDKKRQDLSLNEYLLCCTYPLTNDVHIEI